MKYTSADYLQWALEYSEASSEFDPKRSNIAFDQLTIIFWALDSQNQTHELLPLLSHSDPWVRLSAACHTLHVAEEQALEVLEGIPEGMGSLSMSARMVMEQWREGSYEIAKPTPHQTP